jgi:hypothetical protein
VSTKSLILLSVFNYGQFHRLSALLMCRGAYPNGASALSAPISIFGHESFKDVELSTVPLLQHRPVPVCLSLHRRYKDTHWLIISLLITLHRPQVVALTLPATWHTTTPQTIPASAHHISLEELALELLSKYISIITTILPYHL